jgi:hypothetical protein
MKKILLCAALVAAFVLASASMAFAGVNTWSTVSATQTHNNVVVTGRSGNMVSDMTAIYDVTYWHYAWGYSYTTCNWTAASGKTGAMNPYYLYTKTEVCYASWHLPGILVKGIGTSSNHNASPYTVSYIRAPSNGSQYTMGACQGGIPRYAYTNGTHTFKYNASATQYSWGTHIQINNPNFW